MDLHSDPSAPMGASALLAVEGHDVVGRVTIVVDDAGDVDAVAIDVLAPERVQRVEARQLLDAAVDLAPPGRPGCAILVSDDLVRHEARRAGLTGALQGPLTASASVGAAEASDDLVGAVGALLPRYQVRRRRSLFGSPDLQVVADSGSTLRVRLPRDTEVMAEPVAAAVDTALAVRARFGRAASGIAGVSFDHGGDALGSGAVSGLAEGASGVIVLTPLFVAVDLLVEDRRVRAVDERRTAPALALARPCAVLDAVVAHECWHYLDAEIRVSGTAYVEFNAALGAALGVDTLEHALRGRERDAPGEWRAAHDRLVRDVSAYAGTNPREATAEMFSLWWTAGPPTSPVIERFGELVERFFPR